MNIIKLENRDNADLMLVRRENSDIWDLKVDKNHKYCLNYMRMGGDFQVDESNKIKWNKIQMIDPSGGPYLEIGDYVDKQHKIIEILDATVLRLSEE